MKHNYRENIATVSKEEFSKTSYVVFHRGLKGYLKQKQQKKMRISWPGGGTPIFDLLIKTCMG